MYNKDITIKAKNITSYKHVGGDRYATITGMVDLDDLNKEQITGILPKKYIINDNATILFWNDGTKTVVKKSKDDKYNKKLGFLWAYFQKNSGLSKNKANKYLEELVDFEYLIDKRFNSDNFPKGFADANDMIKGMLKYFNKN